MLPQGWSQGVARAQGGLSTSPDELFRNEVPADSDAVRDFINKHSFNNPSFRREQRGLGAQVEMDGAANATQGSKQVRMIYLIPADKAYREDYRSAIANAIINVQRFYQSQLGNGNAFSLHTPIVESYVTGHPTSFYSTGANAFAGGFWQSVLKDGFALTGGGFSDPNYRWVFYIDADQACGQYMGGNEGVALMAANDLRGLTGQTNIPACANEPRDTGGLGRWIGGLGHELGHTFNLPHPPGCDQGSCPAFSYNSLMYVGYAYYPNTYLLDENKTQLLNTGFFSVQDTSARTISGRVTDQAGNGVSGVALVASGSTSQSAVTDSGGNYVLSELAIGGSYTITPSKANYSFSPPSQSINYIGANETASFTATFTGTETPTLKLSSTVYTIYENDPVGGVAITISRTGDTSAPATLQYSTSDQSGGNECDQVSGKASQRCDYAAVNGTLRFAAGEPSKNIYIPVVDDGYVEGTELLTIKLQNPTGAALDTNAQATVTILDDDNTPAPAANNPYLNNNFFVRMNYLDFLGREPDAGGFADWTNVLNNCGTQQGFLGAPPDCDRAHVSHGFFASPEFTDAGFRIYRMYEVGMGRLPRYTEFTSDMASLSGFGISDTVRQQNLQDFLQLFSNKPEFTNRFSDALQPSQASQLILKLEQAAALTLPDTATTLPGQPQQYGRAELIQKRASGEFTVGQTLKAFVEQQAVYDKFFPSGQVTALYFAYLKRDPDLNDANLSGWKDWVDVFTNGRASAGIPPKDIHHLIFGFIYSEEYRKRFGTP